MFSWWVLWRFVKFLGIGLLAMGVVGATLLPDPIQRQRATYALGTAGFLMTWTAGYGLAKLSGTSLGVPWISLSLLLSLLAMAGALRTAQPGVPPAWAPFLAAAGFLAPIGLMVSRMQDSLTWMLGGVLPVVAGGLLVAIVRRRTADPRTATPSTIFDDRAERWFRNVARAEGVSLLALFGLYMPLKYAAKIQLDGGQGWFGWVHGMLLLLFLLALVHTGWGRWSWKTLGVAFAASMVPFGTFAFERYHLPLRKMDLRLGGTPSA